MRLRNEHSFLQHRYVVRCRGILAGLGPEVGKKVVNQRGDVELNRPGFNYKNDCARETPCDQDYLRELSRGTDSKRLHAWYNQDVGGMWKKHKQYDSEEVFIGDGCYLFVPDKPSYEGSAKLLFNRHNHPVSSEKVRTEDIRKGEYQWRRCYKMVSLLHTGRAGSFCMVVAVRFVPGNRSELLVFYDLLEEFVGAVGEGVFRRVVLDRGFLDGARISWFKRKHKIDFLIPVRSNTDVYVNAMSLKGELSFQPYQPTGIEQSCEVPSEAPKPQGGRERAESAADP